MLNVKTILKETEKKGIGLFSSENIQEGTIVHYDENLFDKEYSLAFVKDNGLEDFFVVYAGFDKKRKVYYLCSDNARFMNHSNTPNTFYDKVKRITIAKCNIPKGTEITTDYREFDDASEDDNLGFKVFN